MSLFPRFAYFVPLFWNTVPASSFPLTLRKLKHQEAFHHAPHVGCQISQCYCFQIVVCYVKPRASVPGSLAKVEATWGLLHVTHVGRLCVLVQTASYICMRYVLHLYRAAACRALCFLPRCSPGPRAPNRVLRRRAVLCPPAPDRHCHVYLELPVTLTSLSQALHQVGEEWLKVL